MFFFDLDGTLIDSNGVWKEVDREFLARRGLPYTHAYYEGVAEVSGFDIADLAVTGQTARAVASCRRALQLGMHPVALATALSMKVAGIARLYSTRTTNFNVLAGQVGMPPWLAEKTSRVARRWSGDNVSKAVILMAELDAEVKGQGGDPEFAIEHAVRRVAELAG